MAQQEDTYPDPAQLRTFAQEPLAFHDLTTSSFWATESKLTATVEHVTYVFTPAYIDIETVDYGHADAETVPWFDRSHKECWDKAHEIDPTADHVSATGMVTDPEGNACQYRADWSLEKITIHANNE